MVDEATEAPKRRPLDEWLVDASRKQDDRWAYVLARISNEVLIPRNHDAIIEAWTQTWGAEKHGVVANLLEQKKEAEKKAKEVKAEVADPSFPY